MNDCTTNGWTVTDQNSCGCGCGNKDDYLPTPPLSPDCPCPPPRPLPPIPGCPPRPCPPEPCQNRTPNYGLPLWKASDVTSWLMQMNGAMLRIDNIMHDLALRTGINGLPDDLVTTVSKLCNDVAVLNCTVGELNNKQANQDLLMQNMNTQFSAMKTDIASLQLSITNLDTRVMTVDSANQQNRNDITLIKSDLNMLSKTVTNLSSNLTQFQNATNQTLATLQTSVDAIVNWMVNPSGNFKTLQQSVGPNDFTVSVTNGTENAELMSDVSEFNTTIIHMRQVVGRISEIFTRVGSKIVIKIKKAIPQVGGNVCTLQFTCNNYTEDNAIPYYNNRTSSVHLAVPATIKKASDNSIHTVILPITYDIIDNYNTSDNIRKITGINFTINAAQFSNISLEVNDTITVYAVDNVFTVLAKTSPSESNLLEDEWMAWEE